MHKPYCYCQSGWVYNLRHVLRGTYNTCRTLCLQQKLQAISDLISVTVFFGSATVQESKGTCFHLVAISSRPCRPTFPSPVVGKGTEQKKKREKIRLLIFQLPQNLNQPLCWVLDKSNNKEHKAKLQRTVNWSEVNR